MKEWKESVNEAGCYVFSVNEAWFCHVFIVNEAWFCHVFIVNEACFSHVFIVIESGYCHVFSVNEAVFWICILHEPSQSITCDLLLALMVSVTLQYDSKIVFYQALVQAF